MTLEEDIKELEEMETYYDEDKDDDIEANHVAADQILLKYVPKELAKAYGAVRKWYA